MGAPGEQVGGQLREGTSPVSGRPSEPANGGTAVLAPAACSRNGVICAAAGAGNDPGRWGRRNGAGEEYNFTGALVDVCVFEITPADQLLEVGFYRIIGLPGYGSDGIHPADISVEDGKVLFGKRRFLL